MFFGLLFLQRIHFKEKDVILQTKVFSKTMSIWVLRIKADM